MNIKSMSRKVITIFLLSILLATAPFAGNTEAASSSEVIKTAKNLIGIKYRSGGTTTAGFDCSGFVGYVYNDLGISLPRTAAGMYSSGNKVSKENLQSGDLVFFNTSGRGVSHVGIYIGDGQFIHSGSSRGVSISSVTDKHYWGARYVGAKRVADVSVAKK